MREKIEADSTYEALKELAKCFHDHQAVKIKLGNTNLYLNYSDEPKASLLLKEQMTLANEKLELIYDEYVNNPTDGNQSKKKDAMAKAKTARNNYFEFKKKDVSQKRHIGDQLGNGGCKTVFMATTEDAIALFNVSNGCNLFEAEMWQRVVAEEVSYSRQLRALGLLTQDYRIDTVFLKDKELPVMRMRNFQQLLSYGIETRDKKSNEAYGSTMLFGDVKNIHDQKHLLKLMSHLKRDIAILVSNGVRLGSDSFNIAIVHKKPHKNDSMHPVLFRRRNHRARLFLYDLTSKDKKLDDTRIQVVHSDGKPDLEVIHKLSQKYLSLTIFALTYAISTEEIEHMMSQSDIKHQFELMSEINTAFKEVEPEILEWIENRVLSQISDAKPQIRHDKFKRRLIEEDKNDGHQENPSNTPKL